MLRLSIGLGAAPAQENTHLLEEVAVFDGRPWFYPRWRHRRGDDPLPYRPAEVIHPGCGPQPIGGWIRRPRPFASGHPGTGLSAPRRRLLPAGSASRFPLGHPARQSAATTAKASNPAAPSQRDGCRSTGEAEPLLPERDGPSPRSPPLDSTCFRRRHLPGVWRRTGIGCYSSLGIRAPHAFPIHSQRPKTRL